MMIAPVKLVLVARNTVLEGYRAGQSAVGEQLNVR